jgi:drug/metabolite transporter (DMT)-like permease
VCRPLVVRHGAIPALAATFLLGGVLAGLMVLADPPASARLEAASPGAWVSLAYLTLFVTVCGLSCQNAALRRFDASQVAAVGNAAPMLSLLWGVWLLNEPLGWSLVLGAALTLGGVIWVSRAGR